MGGYVRMDGTYVVAESETEDDVVYSGRHVSSSSGGELDSSNRRSMSYNHQTSV